MSLLASRLRFRPLAFAHRRHLATVSSAPSSRAPQTLVEKIVQSYAVDVPEGRAVRAGDYVMIQPKHVWVHSRTERGAKTAS